MAMMENPKKHKDKKKKKKEKKDKKRSKKAKKHKDKRNSSLSSLNSSFELNESSSSLKLGDSCGSSSVFNESATNFAFGEASSNSLNFGASQSGLVFGAEEEDDEPIDENPYKTQYITINPNERRYVERAASIRNLPKLDAEDADWLFEPDSSQTGLGLADQIGKEIKLNDDLERKLLREGYIDNGEDEEAGKKSKKSKNKEKHKKKKRSRSKRTKDLLYSLSLDPYKKKSRKKFEDEEVRSCFEDYPDLAGEKYGFSFFEGHENLEIYPLSMLCALGASIATVKSCYEGFPKALLHVDPCIGTAMHYASSFDSASNEVLAFLGKQQPNVMSTVNAEKRTPLHSAILSGAPLSTISTLIELYPKAVLMEDEDGNTPLHTACEEEAELAILEEMMDEFPEACAIKSKSGATPLHLAVFHEASYEIIDSMVATNVKSLEVMDGKGRLPLHVAASCGTDIEIIKLFIQKHPGGAEVRTKAGKTPFGAAKKAKRSKEVLALLKTAAD